MTEQQPTGSDRTPVAPAVPPIDYDKLFYAIYKGIVAAAATVAGASLMLWLFIYMVLAAAG